MASKPVRDQHNNHLLSMQTQTNCRNTGIHHVGLHATNPAASAEFYRDVLSMEIVGGSGADHPFGASAFLSSRPNEESHEVALFANPVYAHIAFKVSSLAELRSFHARIVGKSIPIKFTFNHGASFAFYFDDPDGKLIEVYWPTGATRLKQPQFFLSICRCQITCSCRNWQWRLELRNVRLGIVESPKCFSMERVSLCLL